VEGTGTVRLIGMDTLETLPSFDRYASPLSPYGGRSARAFEGPEIVSRASTPRSGVVVTGLKAW